MYIRGLCGILFLTVECWKWHEDEDGLVKSGGDVGFVFKNDTIFVFLVVLPSALISSSLGAAPWVVFACLKCDQILKCVVAFIKVNRYNWMKNLTRAGVES